MTLCDYISGGASVISVCSDGYLSCMYFCRVFSSDATSVYNCMTAATSLVWCNV